MDITLTFKVTDSIALKRAKLAKKRKSSTSDILRKALECPFANLRGEEEDFSIATDRLAKDDPSKHVSFKEMKRRYRLSGGA